MHNFVWLNFKLKKFKKIIKTKNHILSNKKIRIIKISLR